MPLDSDFSSPTGFRPTVSGASAPHGVRVAQSERVLAAAEEYLPLVSVRMAGRYPADSTEDVFRKFLFGTGKDGGAARILLYGVARTRAGFDVSRPVAVSPEYGWSLSVCRKNGRLRLRGIPSGADPAEFPIDIALGRLRKADSRSEIRFHMSEKIDPSFEAGFLAVLSSCLGTDVLGPLPSSR